MTFNIKKLRNFSFISKAVATKHRNMTTNVTHSDPAFYGGQAVAASDFTEGGASHVSIVDAQELMVSATS
jgi:gamma-glutamyltranspeptidase